jgi:hypothetical protein
MDRDRFDIPLNIRILWTETRLVALETGSHLSGRQPVRGRGACPLVYLVGRRDTSTDNPKPAVGDRFIETWLAGCFANTALQLARSTGIAFKDGRRFKRSL